TRRPPGATLFPYTTLFRSQRERGVVLGARQVPLVEHAERAGGDAVAATVADVLLHDDRAELGAEQRARRAHVEAGGVRAVLADRSEEHTSELQSRENLVCR